MVAVVDRERPQVDVAWRQFVVDLRRHCRQLHDGLRDPATRVASDLLADRCELFFGGLRAEHYAVATGAFDRLDDEFVDPVEHLLAFLVEPAAVGVDVGQQRLLAEVVLDNGRHVGVDQLVVADTVAHRAGDDDVACTRGVE